MEPTTPTALLAAFIVCIYNVHVASGCGFPLRFPGAWRMHFVSSNSLGPSPIPQEPVDMERDAGMLPNE